MRKILLLFVAAIVAASAHASVKVTENPSGTVTIAVDGAAGQIGTSGFQYTSAISSDNQNLIKTAQHVIITGNINANDIKTLVAKNQSGNTWTLNTLDMGGATIDKITVEGNSTWNITSHSFTPNNYTKIACKIAVLPVSSNGALPNYFGTCFTEVLESATLPIGYTSLGDYAFSSKKNLTKIKLPKGLISIGRNAFDYTAISNITLPNSLKSIGEEAFLQCQKMETIVFPASLESIGDKAFTRTLLKDVYFLGKEAPTVGNEVFDAGTYKGNGGMVDTTYPVTSSSIGDTDNGYAERRNYIKGANTFGLLHLRADLNNEQRAKYTDITRDYRVEKGSDNKYKAFNDLYYGTMKVWPGQFSYEKTFNDAVAGTLWDGTTTYNKDKYMGLHKFTITVSNVYNDDTEKWTFDKIQPDQWWTICVPFKMTKVQVREVFGENTEVCKLSEVVRNKEEKRITLKFKDDQYKNASNDDDMVIQDNISYMIFPTKALASGEKYTFDGYQMETGSPEPTIVTATEEGSVTENGGYIYRFIGNYLSTWNANENNGVGKPIYMPQYTYFLGAKGGKHVFFYQTGTTGKWNPFSATVQVFKGQTNFGIDDSFVTESGAKTASFFGTEDDSHTTGIEDVTIEAGNNPATSVVYTLDGRIAGRGQQALNGLKSGIYIVNGKKIVVR